MKRFLGIGLATLLAATAHAGQISVVAAKVCDARDYGAMGNGLTVDTASIQNAIEACAASPSGGIVRLGGSGTFLSGPLELRSHIDFNIEGGSRLLAQHTRLNDVHTNRTMTVVSARGVEDVAVTGAGTIDGNKTFPPGELEQLPHTIEFADVTRGRVEGISLLNSEGMGVLSSREIGVKNVRIVSDSSGQSTGIWISMSKHITVESVSIQVQGFGLGVSSARASSGGGLGSVAGTTDVRIRDCTFQGGQGMLIEAGKDIRAEGLRFAGAAKGIFINANFAAVQSVHLLDIDMFAVNEPLHLQTSSTGSISDLTILHLKAVRANSAGTIAGGDGAPIAGLTLQDVNIEAENGLAVENAQGSFDKVNVKTTQGRGVLLSASANVERK